MKCATACLVVLIILPLLCPAAFGMFMFPETEKVPIDRLFTNLQQRLAKNTNDFYLTYQLARLHSMAYATNRSIIEVVKKDGSLPLEGWSTGIPREIPNFKIPADRQLALNHLTNAITLYERSLALLKTSTKNSAAWYTLRVQLGLAWCLDQSGRRDKALDAYRETLEAAWKQEVTDDVKGAWSVISLGENPAPVKPPRSLGPGVCYSEEVIRYMLNLLDPVKGAKEIAELKEKQKTLNSMGRMITPILVPLESDVAFADLVNPAAKVKFDLDGSGLPRKWGWITPKAAWLVYDSDDSGKITSALQMFGNVTFWIFWSDGYAALASLDDNGDGELQGTELRHLALWQDSNGNGISDRGEVQPVQFFGIKVIACAGQSFSGDTKWNPLGITFTNGEVRPTYDWIAPSE